MMRSVFAVLLVFCVAGVVCGVLPACSDEDTGNATSGSCSPGSSCACTGDGECTRTCTGAGCNLACRGNGACKLVCPQGGCTVDCAGNGACSIAECGETCTCKSNPGACL